MWLQIASKLESTVQQHQAELAERQEQADQLTGQLAAAQQQQEDLQQVSCCTAAGSVVRLNRAGGSIAGEPVLAGQCVELYVYN